MSKTFDSMTFFERLKDGGLVEFTCAKQVAVDTAIFRIQIIQKEIAQSSQQGKYHAQIPFRLNNDEVSKYIDLGYKIHERDPRTAGDYSDHLVSTEKSYQIISWDNNDTE